MTTSALIFHDDPNTVADDLLTQIHMLLQPSTTG